MMITCNQDEHNACGVISPGIQVEEKRVHKKWVELNKQETYFGALRIEAAEAVTRLSSIMMKLNQDAQVKEGSGRG